MGNIDLAGRVRNLEVLASVGLPYLTETWQSAIDAAVWTINLGGLTGSVARDITEEPYQKIVLESAAINDVPRIYTVHEWQLAPDTWDVNTFNKLLIMEWEAKLVVPADILETKFFMGLAASNAAERDSNDIAGFILDGAGVLNSLTDDGGAETAKTVGTPVLTNWHKYKIVAYSACIEFWVDEVMQARHTTAAAEDLPDMNVHGLFYCPAEAAAFTGELHVGITNIRPGVIV